MYDDPLSKLLICLVSAARVTGRIDTVSNVHTIAIVKKTFDWLIPFFIDMPSDPTVDINNNL